MFYLRYPIWQNKYTLIFHTVLKMKTEKQTNIIIIYAKMKGIQNGIFIEI